MNRCSMSMALLLAINLTLAATVPAFAADAEPAKAPAVAETKKEKSPEDVVARVAGTSITRKELDRALTVLAAQNRLPSAGTPEGQKQAEVAALDQLIYAELIYNEGLKKPPADLEKKIDFKMAQNKGKFASQAEFETALLSAGVAEKELVEITKKDIVISNFIEEQIAVAIKVSDEEIKGFYNENRDNLKEEPQVKASHILVGVDNDKHLQIVAERGGEGEQALVEQVDVVLPGEADAAEHLDRAAAELRVRIA